MLKIYHNTRCKTSRSGLAYLEQKAAGKTIEIIQYLKDQPFTQATLSALIKKTGLNPQTLVRTQEPEYKQHYKGQTFSSEEWIQILVKHPKLLHRPLVETNTQAVLAQPPESIDRIL